MKKILSSKITLYTALSVAVLFLAFYIYMIVRPVAYGMKYGFSGETTFNVGGEEITSSFNVDKVFRSNNEAVISNYDTNVLDAKLYYYYQDGYIVLCDVDTEEAFEAEKKEIQSEWDNIMDLVNREEGRVLTQEEDYLLTNVYKVNAFKLVSQAEGFNEAEVCNGTIIFTVLGGVFELVAIGLTVTCLLVAKKKNTATE